ncbi:MAG: iron-sulfur cluster assembly protein [Alicyclobacillus sp.]|nr:iron-sulfur cluster assembly protein [Alicyclobacillus sp.]
MKVTTAAEEELRRLAEAELGAGEFVRIGRSYQCGTSRFQLSVDDTQTVMDERIDIGGVPVVVERACLALLSDCTLDWNGEGLIFLDPVGSAC